jgi:hypothetical protein
MGTRWKEVPAWVTRKGVRSMHTLAVADPPAGSPLRTPRDRRRAFDSQTGAPFGERALSKSHCGDEQGWQALAPVTAATGEIPEQYRRARPSERDTAASTWPGLRCLLDGPTNTSGLRAVGDYEEGASSDHRRQRHPDPGNVHRRTISNRRLRGLCERECSEYGGQFSRARQFIILTEMNREKLG